jgi:hypothetical protein
MTDNLFTQIETLKSLGLTTCFECRAVIAVIDEAAHRDWHLDLFDGIRREIEDVQDEIKVLWLRPRRASKPKPPTGEQT